MPGDPTIDVMTSSPLFRAIRQLVVTAGRGRRGLLMKRVETVLTAFATLVMALALAIPAAGDDGGGGEGIYSPGPKGRCCFAMAYDPDTRLTMLFGGFDDNPQAVLDQTWTWDGTSWHILNPAHKPAARKSICRMVWADNLHQMVLYGGLLTASDTAATDSTTWLWDDATTGLDFSASVARISQMPPLSSYGMSYDSAQPPGGAFRREHRQWAGRTALG